MKELVTLIGGPGDGQRVPRSRPMYRPSDTDWYPYKVLGPVDYRAEEIGFLWPMRYAELLDEELAPLEEYHEVSRQELHALDPFTRYGMLIPEDAIAYRVKFWTTWARRRRIGQQLEEISGVMLFLVGPDEHPFLREYRDEIEQVARIELRELVKLMVPAE